MSKEKIVLGNNTELKYDSIGFQNGCLAIGFIGGDIVTLEESFRSAGQNNLEQIKQMDAEGNVQTTHVRYDIFQHIGKQIAVDAADDVVEVVLGQESETDMRIRHLESDMKDTKDVTKTLLMGDLGGEL